MKQQEWFRAKIRWAVMVEGWEALRFKMSLRRKKRGMLQPRRSGPFRS